jgi:hypothetical protein
MAGQAFTSTGLRPPAERNHVPRTVFDDPDPTAPTVSPARLVASGRAGPPHASRADAGS